MATTKTKTISGRVPLDVANALEADAADLGMAPGSLLRRMLEGRYGRKSAADNSHRSAEKSPSVPDLVEVE